MPSQRTFLSAAFLLGLLLGRGVFAFAAGKAEGLLELTPPNSSFTLAVEGFKDQSKVIRESRLYRTVRAIPSVQRWLDSNEFQKARSAVENLETVLEVNFETIAGSFLGEAVVLSLRLPVEGGAEPPQGLLLLKFKDRELLERLIKRFNAAQKDAGELVAVSECRHQGQSYSLRTFQPGSKAPEWYAILGSDTFAWSNSEETIRGVIERRTQGKGLAEEPRFKAVRDQLPSSAMVSLFVDPRTLGTLLNASPPPQKPEEIRLLASLTGYLKALKFTGASISWNNGPVLRLEEAVDPEKLAPELRNWGKPSTQEGERPGHQIPASAFAMANASVDFTSVVTLFEQIMLEDSPIRLKNLWAALDGIFLGMNAKTAVLGRLGPEVAGYLETPESRPQGALHWPAVLVIALPGKDSGRIGQALVNGLKTVLAFTALDEKRLAEQLRVETKLAHGTAVNFLAPSAKFAFGADGDRFVIGNSPDAVIRAFDTEKPLNTRFEQLRARFLKDEGSYACVDLHLLHKFADQKRSQIAKDFAGRGHRPEEDVVRDLNQVLDLIAPFDAAYLTSRIDPGFERVHRTIGLVGAGGSTP